MTLIEEKLSEKNVFSIRLDILIQFHGYKTITIAIVTIVTVIVIVMVWHNNDHNHLYRRHINQLISNFG